MFDLQPHLVAIAARQNLERCAAPLQMAYTLNNGNPLAVFTTQSRVSLNYPAIVRVHDPEIANVTLIAHEGDPRATAARVEDCFMQGQRVALWDAQADSALIYALFDTIIYFGNLAALDTDLERTLAAVMTPLREGAALRKYLADSLLQQWIWEGVVRPDMARLVNSFGHISDMRQAETQARSRLGGWLIRLKRRGLPYEIHQLGFKHNRLDGFWMTLKAV